MNPLKYAQMMKYLTRAKKQNPELPDVFPASETPIPKKKQDTEEIEAINRFVLANPRQDMAGGGMLVQPGFGGTRQGYSGEFGPNIRKFPKSDSFEVTLNRGGKTYYKTFSYGDGSGQGPKPSYATKEEALKAANKFRDSVKNLPKATGKQSKGQPVGFKKQTGGQAAIRKALNDIIEVGGKSFSNEDLRKLVDIDLFPDDDQFRKAVDVVKKEPEFKNLTFNKKPRPRLKDDPVSVLKAATQKRRKKKLDLLGSREYEKELYNFKKEIQEALGLKTVKTTGAISGKPREFLPIDMGHQSSIDQLKLLKQKLRPEDLGPQFYRANREGIRKFEGGVRTLEANLKKNFYPKQKKLYNQAIKFINAGQEIPADLQNKIINLNENIQIFIDKTVEKYPLLKNRVNAVTIDPINLDVKRGGNVFKQLGIGLVDQDLGNIKIGSLDDLTIKANLAEQTLKEATDAGLIDKNIGRQRLDKFLNVKNIQTSSGSAPSLGSLDVPSMFKRLSPATRKLVSGFGGFVLPEVLFYQLDKRNRMSKGQSEKEAAAGALESGTLGAYENKAYMEGLKKVAESMNIDSKSFDSAYQLNLLTKSYNQNSANYEKNYMQLLEMGDKKRAEDLKKNFDRYTKETQNKYSLLTNNISDNVMNTVGASPLIMKEGRENITQQQFEKPFFDMRDVAIEKLKKEKQKAFPTQSRQVDTAAGSVGEGFYQAFDSLTRGAKNLLQGRIIPFGPDRLKPLESEREREARYLKDMDPRELFLYNKARGVTYDQPITPADFENLIFEQPGLFAGGGIAKLAGADQGPPPERGPNSQGLQGLMKRVRNL